MSYHYSAVGYAAIPAISQEAYAAFVEKQVAERAAAEGLTPEQWKQKEAERRAAMPPTPPCSPVGKISTATMTGKQIICTPEGFLDIGYKRAIRFGGRDTTVADECLRAGVPLSEMPTCAKKDPPPHQMRHFKNLADPYKEWAFQQYKLLPALEQAGVPQSLIGEVANEYKKRVKMLNSYGGTEYEIKKRQGINPTQLSLGLNVLSWYNKGEAGRIKALTTKYKAKITRVTQKEAAQAAQEQAIDDAIRRERTNKALLYGGIAAAVAGAAILLT
jgi:hypothetical protein